ncbi:uncharacterized protein [Typha angustifolia]|uniref:uncharacterized protein isoform X2 n=1 Tax=Typha angustifolia TaxID=59011 RepID=UPI003C3053AE
MAGCNEEAPVQNKYAGIAPKKPPLIAMDHERAYFDSADWVLGKQGVNNTAVTAIESLKPKLKRTPHHQLPPRKPACTSDGKNSIVDKHVREARTLFAKQEPADVTAAVGLLDAALAISPHLEAALELKARALLFLRRFRDVADMLQEYIPSYRMANDDDSGSSFGSGDQSSRVKLLSPDRERSDGGIFMRCFSVSDLKKRFLAWISKNGEKEGQWRYSVLGQACFHLGLMEDAMVLLQTSRRLASAAFRRESICWSDDSFSSSSSNSSNSPPSSSSSHLLSHIKLLRRRRAAAVAALDAGLHSESIRHFTKLLLLRRSTIPLPHPFAASCLVGRAAAFRAAGKISDAIADCNRALALDPASIPALRARAELLNSISAAADCLRDLDHLKLLYDSLLRDRNWRPHRDVGYREIPSVLSDLNSRIQELRRRVTTGDCGNVDYYALIGVRQGCSRSELERAHLLLCLKHKPENAAGFIERLEFADEEHRDLDAIKDQAKMSALILYRMLQKGYASIMADIMMQEAAEKQRAREAAAAAAKQAASSANKVASCSEKLKADKCLEEANEKKAAAAAAAVAAMTATATAAAAPVYQGVFCRDLAVVGSLLSQVGFNRAIPVKYEALSC